MSFYSDWAPSESLSSGVATSPDGGDLLAVSRVDVGLSVLDAGVLPVHMNVDALSPSSTTSSHESGVCGGGDGAGDVPDGGMCLGVAGEADGPFRSSTVLGAGCLDDPDDEADCSHNG